MRRFLYFLPGVPGGNRQMLADRGLLSRFRKFGGELVEHAYTQCLSGPGGRSGCIVAAGPAHVAAEFSNTGQRWAEGEKFWVGIEDVNDPPRPGSLAREIGLDGYAMTLGDSHEWRVPLLHRWEVPESRYVPNMPKRLTPVRHADGGISMQSSVIPEYAEADALATRIFAAFLAGETVSLERLFLDAVSVLGVNYHIGPEEAGLLGLLDAAAAMQVMRLCVDLPKLESHQEQSASEGLVFQEPVIKNEDE